MTQHTLKLFCVFLIVLNLCSCAGNRPHHETSTSAAPLQNDASNQELARRSLEIAKLEAEKNRSDSVFINKTRKKCIGTRTQEYRYELYADGLSAKIENIGNLNYPEAARRQRIYGKLQLTMNIRADGSIESVEINKSSGQRILDDAAQRIVKLAAPYAPFPPDIRKETDILSITRTWTFTTNDQLESE